MSSLASDTALLIVGIEDDGVVVVEDRDADVDADAELTACWDEDPCLCSTRGFRAA
jgi:hypothetical protein